MITTATKAIVAQAIDVVHTVGMAERSNKLVAFQAMLLAVGKDGTRDTLMQLAELLADNPKIGATDDWWQP